MKTFNELAEYFYQENVKRGFHEGQINICNFVANLHSEVSELWEAWRKGALREPCDKAAKMEEPLTCAEEEIADIIIRTLDTAYTLGVDIDRAIRVKDAYNKTRPYRHGGKKA